MTIGEVLYQVDELKPNTYDDQMKITWLAELDGKIFNEVILTHEHEDGIEFHGYGFDDLGQVLLVDHPYADIYRAYLFAMIDFSNAEADRYQMSLSLFQSNYRDFISNYNKTHMPMAKPLQLF